MGKSSAAVAANLLVLICGDDEFAVKQRAREIFQGWLQEVPGADQDILDGAVSNSGEALKVMGRLREALQTLPFFGTDRFIWLQNCNFLGEERAASAQAVTEALAEFSQDLKKMIWTGVKLLISSGKVDKRKTFFKTLEKVGTVQVLAGWSADSSDWTEEAEAWARTRIAERKKNIAHGALASLISNVGPNARLLAQEIEKLCLFVGDRPAIALEDVESIVTRNKQARAFALGDALGDRDIARLLKCLNDELWEVRLDPQRSEIGLLYGLISKVRALIFLKELVDQGLLREEKDYNRFKAQLSRIPNTAVPEDKRFNPLAMNPYVLFKALPQAGNYEQVELIRAMRLLLDCNMRLVSSSGNPEVLLQQTLIGIVSRS